MHLYGRNHFTRVLKSSLTITPFNVLLTVLWRTVCLTNHVHHSIYLEEFVMWDHITMIMNQYHKMRTRYRISTAFLELPVRLVKSWKWLYCTDFMLMASDWASYAISMSGRHPGTTTMSDEIIIFNRKGDLCTHSLPKHPKAAFYTKTIVYKGRNIYVMGGKGDGDPGCTSKTSISDKLVRKFIME